MSRLLLALALRGCAKGADHATVWIGDAQAGAPVQVSSSVAPFDVDASPPIELGEVPPEGVYAVTVERVSDSCNPKRPTFDAGLQALTIDEKGNPPYPMLIPYPTTGPRPIRAERPIGVETQMPLQFYAGCTRLNTRVDRTFAYEGSKGDSFTILAREYWPDTTGCPVGPEGVPNPVNACRSERLVRYRLVSGCNSHCPRMLPRQFPDGGLQLPALCVCLDP